MVPLPRWFTSYLLILASLIRPSVSAIPDIPLIWHKILKSGEPIPTPVIHQPNDGRQLQAINFTDYTGVECKGVVTFPIPEEVNTQSLDFLVGMIMTTAIPLWVEQDCLAAIWSLGCMKVYSNVIPQGYCFDSCVSNLEQCSDALSAAGALGTQYMAAFDAICSNITTTRPGCVHSGK